jgi:hypothetical protein
MAIRKAFLASTLLLLLPATARADRHWWDVNASATVSDGGSALWGEQVSVNWALPNPSFGVVADFSHQSKSGLERNTFLTGVRYMPPYKQEAGEPADEPHTSPFVQVLLGEVHTTRQGVKRTDFSAAVGAGIDTPLVGKVYGRLQADIIRSWSEGRADTVFRVSAGVVFRVERPHPHQP